MLQIITKLLCVKLFHDINLVYDKKKGCKMRIQAINQNVYQKTQARRTVKNVRQEQTLPETNSAQVAFKGEKGALLGILGGAALGALGAAVVVATGGLAGAVAAVGLSGTMVGGAAAGTHIGGIVGSEIEDKLDDDKKD